MASSASGLLILTAVLVGGAPRTLRAEDPPQPLRGKNYLVPALQIPVFHLVTHVACRLACQMPDFDVTWSTIETNLTSEWQLDDDAFVINNLLHPYQGATAFSAARSNGLSFWESAPYVIGSSLLWELFFESTLPSINDLVVTSVGGVLLGEAMHRSAALVRGAQVVGTGARELGAFVVEPIGSLNRLLLGPATDDVPVSASIFGTFAAGAALGQRYRTRLAGEHTSRTDHTQGHLGLELEYGPVGDASTLKPFDQFSLDLEVTVSHDPGVALFIRGLLIGRRYQLGPHWQGVWGLVSTLDYLDPTIVQTSTVGLGLGSTSRYDLGERTTLRPTLLAAAVPLGAAGALGARGDDPSADAGPGVQSLLGLSVVREGLGWLTATGRTYLLSGAYRGGGRTAVLYGTASANVRLFGWNALGAEVVGAWRSVRGSSTTPEMDQDGRVVRVYWTVFTDRSRASR